MALRLVLTKSLANVRSGTDAFGYEALSFTIVEHSTFNPRNLPTTGLSEGRLRAEWRLSDITPPIVIQKARSGSHATGGYGLCGRARSGHEHLQPALHAGRIGPPDRVADAGDLRCYLHHRRRSVDLCHRSIPPPSRR